MPELAVTAFSAMVIGYVLLSRRLDSVQITAPIVFVALGTAVGITTTYDDTTVVRTLAETTLALVLFHDAAQVRPRELGRDAGLCARLLLVGLPLTMLAGYVCGLTLFPSASGWLVLLLAAALAPTDAGLGAATVMNPVVPERIRRVLNVESGLNDGLSTPVVVLAITAVSLAGEQVPVGGAVREIAIGVIVGVVLGGLAGSLIRLGMKHGLTDGRLVPIATLAVPVAAYHGAVHLSANGFVATFVAGIAYAAALRSPSVPKDAETTDVFTLTELSSLFVGYAVWVLFGVVLVARVSDHLTWQAVLFAVLSLTVLRMVPVALSLWGSGLRPASVLFIGWFGPRGLASVVFVLLALEALPATPAAQEVFAAITLTVVLSVVLHGASAGPGARAYGAWVTRTSPRIETETP